MKRTKFDKLNRVGQNTQDKHAFRPYIRLFSIN